MAYLLSTIALSSWTLRAKQSWIVHVCSVECLHFWDWECMEMVSHVTGIAVSHVKCSRSTCQVLVVSGKVTLDAPNLLLHIGAELKKRPAAAPKAATALAAAPKAAAAAPAAAPKAAPKAGPKAAAAPADGRPPLEPMGLWARPKLKQATSKITFFCSCR